MDTPRLRARVPADLPTRLAAHLPAAVGGTPEPVVSLVRLHGVIAATTGGVTRSVINAHGMEKTLERAFAPKNLAAVALLVNSPGGSPTQSALVGDRIRQLADDKKVPVLAFCEDVAASGGYWLACAADEIHAHPTSIVGSIGVISAGFGLEGLIERIGVERRLHTAGLSKSRLDPFLPEKPEDVAWLRELQDRLHDQFRDWVVARRGDRLVEGEDLFTGEVWLGDRAKELGLVDGLGTARAVLTERFPDAKLQPVEGRRPLIARLGVGGGALAGAASATDAALDLALAAEVRAAWARYGL